MTDITMTPSRPYLIRALYEWISDNGLTPYIVVDVSDERVRVPRESVKDGQIVLNIAARAVGQFSWDNDSLAFSARFGGVSRNLHVPMSSILSIYARENGAGMIFAEAELPVSEDEADAPDSENTTTLSAVATEDDNQNEDNSDSLPEPPLPEPPQRPAGKPSLKIVK